MNNKKANNKVILNLFQNLHLINNKTNEEMLKSIYQVPHRNPAGHRQAVRAVVQHDGMGVRAFTLIELLVVVLIIGILTAVAFPKYQVAVQKSRFAGLMPLAKSVKNAEEDVLMARGGYTENLEDLSIKVPGGEETTITPKDTEDESYVRASKSGLNNRLVMYLAQSKRYANEIHCEAEQENKIAKQICLSYGGNPTAVTGTADSSGYDTYVLQGTGADAGSIGGGVNDANDVVILSRTETWTCEGDGGEEECRGEDADGVNYIVYRDGTGDPGAVEESWTEMDGENRIEYWGQCYGGDGQVDANYRCTELPEWARTFYDSDGHYIKEEMCCNGAGRVCSEWCEGE